MRGSNDAAGLAGERAAGTAGRSARAVGRRFLRAERGLGPRPAAGLAEGLGAAVARPKRPPRVRWAAPPPAQPR